MTFWFANWKRIRFIQPSAHPSTCQQSLLFVAQKAAPLNFHIANAAFLNPAFSTQPFNSWAVYHITIIGLNVLHNNLPPSCPQVFLAKSSPCLWYLKVKDPGSHFCDSTSFLSLHKSATEFEDRCMIFVVIRRTLLQDKIEQVYFKALLMFHFCFTSCSYTASKLKTHFSCLDVISKELCVRNSEHIMSPGAYISLHIHSTVLPFFLRSKLLKYYRKMCKIKQ